MFLNVLCLLLRLFSRSSAQGWFTFYRVHEQGSYHRSILYYKAGIHRQFMVHFFLCLTNACCCMYSLELLMMDEKPSETCRVSFQSKINLIHWCI